MDRPSTSMDHDVPSSGEAASADVQDPSTSTTSRPPPFSPEEHPVTGLRKLNHGITFQCHILMYLMIRLINLKYLFKISTEHPDAEKFEDVYMEYRKEDEVEQKYLFLQAKHSKTGNEKLFLNDFLPNIIERKRKNPSSNLSKESEPFDLRKYFRSYLEILKKWAFSSSTNTENRIFVLVTNKALATEKPKRSTKIILDTAELAAKDFVDLLNTELKTFTTQFQDRDQIASKICGENPISYEMEVKVNNFLRELKIAVSYPSIKELRSAIKEELQSNFQDRIKADSVFDKFNTWVHDWIDKEKAVFKVKENVTDFLDDSSRNKFENVFFNVHGPSESFIGRDQPIADMHNQLLSTRKNVHKPIDVVVTGMGGVGKTEILLQFINQYKDKFQHILWVNAENQTTFHQSFVDLAYHVDILGDKQKQLPINVLVNKIYEFFQNNTTTKCLIVLDNAQSFHSSAGVQGISKYLPGQFATASKLDIIVTSQLKDGWDCAKQIPLEILSQDDSVEFLKTKLDKSLGTDKEFAELSQKLQGLPLALQLCGDVILQKVEDSEVTQDSYLINDYLDSYKECERELLFHKFTSVKHHKCESSLMITWFLALRSVKSKTFGDVSIKLLNTMSCLEAQNIPVSLFKNLDWIPTGKLGRALKILDQHSLINIEAGRINIHRIIHAVTRENLKPQGEAEGGDTKRDKIQNDGESEALVLGRTLDIFNKDIETNVSANKHLTISEGYIAHAMRAWKSCVHHKDLLGTFADLPSHIINYLIFNNMLESAKSFYDFYESTLKENYDASHPFHLAAKGMYSSILLESGKSDEALVLLNDILKAVTEQKNEKWYVYAEALNNKAAILYKKYQLAEALSCYEELVQIFKEKLGTSIVLTMRAMHCRANVLVRQGRLPEAYEALQDVLKLEKENLDENNVLTLNTMQSIARVLHEMKNPTKQEEVMELYTAVLEGMKKNYQNPDHPEILNTRCNLAGVLTDQGNLDLAEEILKDTTEKLTTLFTTDHPNTLISFSNLGRVQMLQGKLQTALNTFEWIDEKLKCFNLSENQELRDELFKNMNETREMLSSHLSDKL